MLATYIKSLLSCSRILPLQRKRVPPPTHAGASRASRAMKGLSRIQEVSQVKADLISIMNHRTTGRLRPDITSVMYIIMASDLRRKMFFLLPDRIPSIVGTTERFACSSSSFAATAAFRREGLRRWVDIRVRRCRRGRFGHNLGRPSTSSCGCGSALSGMIGISTL